MATVNNAGGGGGGGGGGESNGTGAIALGVAAAQGGDTGALTRETNWGRDSPRVGSETPSPFIGTHSQKSICSKINIVNIPRH